MELVTSLAGLERGDQELVERLEVRVGCAEDEGMIAGIDGGGDEGSGFSVCARNSEEVGAWLG